jgi:hypothetical protein
MHSIAKLNKKELRDFGLLFAVFFAGIFGLILPAIRGHALPAIPWMVAAIFCFLSLLVPSTLQPIYQVWMRIGLVLGWINTRIILGLIFYLLLMPMGIIMRLLKHDPLARKFEVRLSTYRLPSKTITRESMENPY